MGKPFYILKKQTWKSSSHAKICFHL